MFISKVNFLSIFLHGELHDYTCTVALVYLGSRPDPVLGFELRVFFILHLKHDNKWVRTI